MDPNEALSNLRDAIGLSTALSDGDPVDHTAEQILADMTEAAQALDDWLSRDGFLPTDWMAEEDKPREPRPGDLCYQGKEPDTIVHHRCDQYADGTITSSKTGKVLHDPNGC